MAAPDRRPRRSRGQRIPLWLNLLYTAFVAGVVPIYWRTYGPANFLWFCDAALLITAVAIWLESALLASMQAIAMALPQAVWIADFVSGGRLIGVSAYMFEPAIPWHVRWLSTFHLWLPLLLLWMVMRLGYDRRALGWQSALAIGLLLGSYALTDPAHPPVGYPTPAVNVNRVFGPAPAKQQTWMPPQLYLGIETAFWIVCVYLPSHMMFRRVFEQVAASSPAVSPLAAEGDLARAG